MIPSRCTRHSPATLVTGCSWLRFVHRTPLRRLALITPDKGGQALTWLVEGAPGTTWQPGAYYERNKPATSTPQADDAALARQLWDRSAALLAWSPSGPDEPSRKARQSRPAEPSKGRTRRRP